MSFRKEIYTAKYNINLLWLLNIVCFLLVHRLPTVSNNADRAETCGAYKFKCNDDITYQLCETPHELMLRAGFSNENNPIYKCPVGTRCNEDNPFFCSPVYEDDDDDKDEYKGVSERYFNHVDFSTSAIVKNSKPEMRHILYPFEINQLKHIPITLPDQSSSLIYTDYYTTKKNYDNFRILPLLPMKYISNNSLPLSNSVLMPLQNRDPITYKLTVNFVPTYSPMIRNQYIHSTLPHNGIDIPPSMYIGTFTTPSPENQKSIGVHDSERKYIDHKLNTVTLSNVELPVFLEIKKITEKGKCNSNGTLHIHNIGSGANNNLNTTINETCSCFKVCIHPSHIKSHTTIKPTKSALPATRKNIKSSKCKVPVYKCCKLHSRQSTKPSFRSTAKILSHTTGGLTSRSSMTSTSSPYPLLQSSLSSPAFPSTSHSSSIKSRTSCLLINFGAETKSSKCDIISSTSESKDLYDVFSDWGHLKNSTACKNSNQTSVEPLIFEETVYSTETNMTTTDSNRLHNKTPEANYDTTFSSPLTGKPSRTTSTICHNTKPSLQKYESTSKVSYSTTSSPVSSVIGSKFTSKQDNKPTTTPSKSLNVSKSTSKKPYKTTSRPTSPAVMPKGSAKETTRTTCSHLKLPLSKCTPKEKTRITCSTLKFTPSKYSPKERSSTTSSTLKPMLSKSTPREKYRTTCCPLEPPLLKSTPKEEYRTTCVSVKYTLSKSKPKEKHKSTFSPSSTKLSTLTYKMRYETEPPPAHVNQNGSTCKVNSQNKSLPSKPPHKFTSETSSTCLPQVTQSSSTTKGISSRNCEMKTSKNERENISNNIHNTRDALNTSAKIGLNPRRFGNWSKRVNERNFFVKKNRISDISHVNGYNEAQKYINTRNKINQQNREIIINRRHGTKLESIRNGQTIKYAGTPSKKCFTTRGVPIFKVNNNQKYTKSNRGNGRIQRMRSLVTPSYEQSEDRQDLNLGTKLSSIRHKIKERKEKFHCKHGDNYYECKFAKNGDVKLTKKNCLVDQYIPYNLRECKGRRDCNINVLNMYDCITKKFQSKKSTYEKFPKQMHSNMQSRMKDRFIRSSFGAKKYFSSPVGPIEGGYPHEVNILSHYTYNEQKPADQSYSSMDRPPSQIVNYDNKERAYYNNTSRIFPGHNTIINPSNVRYAHPYNKSMYVIRSRHTISGVNNSFHNITMTCPKNYIYDEYIKQCVHISEPPRSTSEASKIEVSAASRYRKKKQLHELQVLKKDINTFKNIFNNG